MLIIILLGTYLKKSWSTTSIWLCIFSKLSNFLGYAFQNCLLSFPFPMYGHPIWNECLVKHFQWSAYLFFLPLRMGNRFESISLKKILLLPLWMVQINRDKKDAKRVNWQDEVPPKIEHSRKQPYFVLVCGLSEAPRQ